jgi:hypothetical protein
MTVHFFPILLFLAFTALTPPAEYVGHWKGEARIGVTFVRRPALEIDVVIHPDGAVTGTVGDARIASGRFEEHTWYEKLFGNKGYVLRVKLAGDLIADEKIRRDGAFIILVDCSNGFITGAVNSSGTEGFPGAASYNKRRMAVVTHDLRLKKQ